MRKFVIVMMLMTLREFIVAVSIPVIAAIAVAFFYVDTAQEGQDRNVLRSANETHIMDSFPAQSEAVVYDYTTGSY